MLKNDLKNRKGVRRVSYDTGVSRRCKRSVQPVQALRHKKEYVYRRREEIEVRIQVRVGSTVWSRYFCRGLRRGLL